MLDVAIMLEGQNGVNWENFKRIALFAEEAGFAGLYRSDHFTNASAPDRDSLELWVSLTWLASHTSRIEFGPMVSPVSFRDPVFTARIGKDIDDLSGGRLHLGVGAGWQDREHDKFGYDLLDLDGRFNRFREGLEVITRLLKHEGEVSFSGDYYSLSDAQLLPHPQRPGGPPILIGGNGKRRTLPLVAQYADMWNAIFLTPAQFSEHSALLDGLLQDAGRAPADVHRSMMTGLWFGDDDTINKRIADHPRFDTREQVMERGVVVGGVDAVVDHLGRLAEAGLQRVMLQWLDLDDMDGLEKLARVLEQFG